MSDSVTVASLPKKGLLLASNRAAMSAGTPEMCAENPVFWILVCALQGAG